MQEEQGLSYQQIELVEQKEQEYEKYAIILVGKTGVGKTAIARHFSSPQANQMLSQIQYLQTQSLKPICVEVAEQFQIFLNRNIKLFIIDTPGYESTDRISLVLQEIDSIILQQKCGIIGLCYVVDLDQRQFGQNGEETIWPYQQIFKRLKIPESLKSKLHFTLLSKWDKYFQDEETNQDRFKSFSQELQKKHREDLWQNRIEWASRDFCNFDDDSETQQKHLQSQKRQFLNKIQRNYENRFSYKEFQKCYQNFVAKFYQEILQKIEHHSQQIQNQWIYTADFEIELSIKDIVNKKLGVINSVLGTLSTIGGVVRIGFSVFAFATGTALTVTGLIIPVLGLAGASIGILGIRYGIKKLMKDKSQIQSKTGKISQASPFEQQIKSKLTEKFQTKKRQLFLYKIISCIKIENNSLKDNQIYFVKNEWIKEVYVTVKGHKKCFNSKYKVSEIGKTLKIQCSMPSPSLQRFISLLDESTIKFYGK